MFDCNFDEGFDEEVKVPDHTFVAHLSKFTTNPHKKRNKVLVLEGNEIDFHIG
jgi:hypothetical protein